MLRALDALFEFCASLKLAVLVILTIATLLGIATFYEARYGMAAVQQLVYGSNLFIASMALLAVNVMAAAVIRYPWKRKQTGFVITHLGILVLLAGCLISFRTSVDGRVAFRPGDTHDDIAQINEVMQLSVAGQNWTLPVNFWSPAGFPSAARALLPNWPEPTWVGPNPSYTLADGVQLDVLEWLPAAKLVRQLTPEPTGTPAAEIRISGMTPAEIPVEEKVLLVLPRGETGITQSLFGGLLEVALWTTPHTSDIDAFLAPPTPASLGELGTLSVYVGTTTPTTVPVTRDPAAITRLPSGHQVSILQYLPQAAVDGDKLLPAGPEAVAPVLRIRILNPDNSTRDYLVSARHPYLSLQTSPPSSPATPGKPATDSPRFRFDHPAMYAAIADGTRGRLHLLQGPDGTLYYRTYANEGVRASGKLTPGDTELAKWMGLAASVTSHFPAAIVTESYARAYVPPAKLNEAMRAMRVAVTVDGKRREAWIARGAAPKGVDSPRGVATLAYGFEALKLPFSLAMLDAKKINNPGTTDAAAYESSMIVNHPDGTTHRQTITMNQPLTVGNILTGFTFYQAGFDDGLGAPISTLSVRRDPGTVPKYLGSALICLGIFTMFYMKAYFQKPTSPSQDKGEDNHRDTEAQRKPIQKTNQSEHPEPVLTHSRHLSILSYLRSSAFIYGSQRLLRISLCLCASVVLFPSFSLAQDLDPLRTIPLLDGGRIKPLDSVARESVRIMTGRESFQRNDPLALVFAIHRDPVSWETRPLIHVPYLSLRTMIGLPADVQYATPAQVRSSEPYRAFLAAVIAKQRAAAATSEDPRLTREETAATELSHRIHMYDALVSGEHFGILPAHANASALDHDPWLTVDRLAAAPDPASRAVYTAWQKVVLSSKDPAASPPAMAAESLRLAVSSTVGPNYADPALLSREVAYHALHPFRIAWITYLATLAVLCASLMIKSPWVYRAGMAMLIASIAWSIFAFAWRCSITGWAPVTNIYETVIWVALVGSVVAVCIEFAHGGKTAAIAGTIGAIAAGLVADIMPPEFGASVQNLAPVLRSNLWLTVHVLTIVSSYAAFLVALVLGNILLAQFAWRPASKASIALNLKHLVRSLQVGVLLVAAGTILGGLWADVSWGRFWGWDPKEVWALIILLVYLALLHGRMAGWVGTWGLAAGAVVAFLTVLMSWYGVNFVLGAGLHSYGFGTGGQLYVAIFCLLQLAYVAVCYFARRAHTPSVAPQTSSSSTPDPVLPPSKSLSSAK